MNSLINSRRINSSKKTPRGKMSLMKMRKEPLLNLCELNLGCKNSKNLLPWKYQMKLKNHSGQGEESVIKTRLRLASITKIDTQQMRLKNTTKEVQKGQTTKVVELRMNQHLLWKVSTKTIGS
jgi:hypothetical protein